MYRYTCAIALISTILSAVPDLAITSAVRRIRGSNHKKSEEMRQLPSKIDRILLDPFQQRLLQQDLRDVMERMGPVPTDGDLGMQSAYPTNVTTLRRGNVEDRDLNEETEEMGRDLSIHKRIVNGWEATEETKYFCMTMEKSGGRYYRGLCGATLIADQWAVTASHCISNNSPDDLKSEMGAVYCNALAPWANNGNKPFQTIDIEKIVQHPDHTPQGAPPNDICLLKLVKPAHPYLSRIPIADPSYVDHYVPAGSQLLVSGFGQTGHAEGKSMIVKHALVPKVNWKTCNNAMGQWNLDHSMMCAGGDGRADACGGDSGGPIVSTRDNVPVLVGIVSWGYKCNVEDYPGVYCDVSKFVDWISSETDNASGLRIVSAP